MKKLNQIKRGLLVASFLLGAAILPMACQQEEVITLPADGGFLITLQEEALDVTRSTPAELGKPLATQFHLKVEKEGGGVIYNQLYTDQLIAASAGRYNLTATYGENVPLAWDAPYYEGTAQAEVTQGTTPVTLPCRVANALLSVKYSKPELFNQVYSQYYVSVNVENSSLQISQAEEKQSAYFRAGQPLTVTFHGTLKEGAKEVTTDLTGLLKEKLQLKDELILQAADHAKLTLAASNTVLKVEKLEIKKETIQETIPQEWLPKPKVSGFAEGATTLQYVETNAAMPAAIAFTASTPIQDAEFTLSLEDKQFTSLNGSYKLSTLSQEQRTQLESVGIQPPYIGEKNGSFNLTHLTARLQTNAGTTTSNRITFRVKANNRWSAEADAIPTYTIETLKPEFSIEVQEGNVWSKEFTINECIIQTGNEQKIKDNLIYQYSTDGQQWTECNNINKQIFEQHPYNKDYQVRAIYRGAITSNICHLTLETPFIIPNGNMEKWTSSKRYEQPYYQPWDNSEAQWWDSNNNETMPKKYSLYPNYKCFPTTTFENNNNNKAAVIRSVAVGGINSEILGNGSTAGILYAGTTDDKGNRTEGRECDSRPTHLSFKYKYESYNNEHFGAYIELFSGETQIASGEYTSTQGESITNFITEKLPIIYINQDLKATSVRIRFYSVPTNPATRKITVTIPDGNYKIYGGSVLVIDDVELVYDK